MAAGLTGVAPTLANVASVAQSSAVSADPADTTPHVQDGKVLSILPVGDRIFVGGTFTKVKNQGASTAYDRSGLFAMKKDGNGDWRVDESFIYNFSVASSAVDPVTGEETGNSRGVQAMVASADGQSIFVAGDWDGGGRKLIKLSIASSSEDPTFRAQVHSAVKDIVLQGDRIIAAGKFTKIGPIPTPPAPDTRATRLGLAAFDTGDGSLDSEIDIPFTVPRQGAESRVESLAITPDGDTLVTGGNFTMVDGQEQWQVALLDVTPGQDAELINWKTKRYDDRRTSWGAADPTDPLICAEKFDTHVKDLDVSPDGKYFVVVTTGGFTSRGPLCDTAARWELDERGSDLIPTWANYDGGDTFTGVTVTGSAIYASGHMRWMNNYYNEGSSTDAVAGPGAVVREGIVALDPVSGQPLAWAPNRERGHGAEALVATSEGLWVGSDTDFIGNRDFGGAPRQGEFHQKLALFPLQGGFTPVTHTTQQFPADLYSVGDGGISKRFFDGSQLGSASVLSTPGTNWANVKGAFTVDDRLYTGWNDGKLRAQTLAGGVFSAPAEVPLRGLDGSHFPVSSLTGMFYDKGRIYFTVAGKNDLYYRSFLPGATIAEDIVGDQGIKVTAAAGATKVDWTKVAGMTMAGGKLFWAEGTALKSIAFANGKLSGSVSTVSSSAGPAGRGLFLMPVTTTPPTFEPPPVTPPVTTVPNVAGRDGYWMVGSDGRVFPFGDAVHHGDALPHLGSAVAVDLEPTPSFNGYWIVDDLGRVFAFGDARSFGNVDRARLANGEKITSLSSTRSGNGYWIFTSRGRTLAFGDATFLGDMAGTALQGAVLDSIPTPSGHGYYMVAADGGIFSFGDAAFMGSMGGKRLNAPVQSLVPAPDGKGYWLVASDGGIFAFGSAPFRGSMGSTRLNKPVTGMVRYYDGYLMVGEDGGIFNFSSAQFKGSLGDRPPAKPIVSVAAIND